jgi:biopolymer transport protein ExbD
MVIPSPRPRRRARIEIIPLIDIIFFLLATFIMVSLSMIKNQGLSVRLPVAGAGSTQDRNEAVTISVSEAGSYAWNKESIQPSELEFRLIQLKAAQPDAKVIINGDERAQLQSVVTILDEARKAGVAKVIIQTTPKS